MHAKAHRSLTMANDPRARRCRTAVIPRGESWPACAPVIDTVMTDRLNGLSIERLLEHELSAPLTLAWFSFLIGRKPARNLSVSMDYTNTTIADMGVIDAVATAKPAQVVRTPEKTPGRALTVEAQGWLMPKTGFTFTWTLDTELPWSDERARAA